MIGTSKVSSLHHSRYTWLPLCHLANSLKGVWLTAEENFRSSFRSAFTAVLQNKLQMKQCTTLSRYRVSVLCLIVRVNTV